MTSPECTIWLGWSGKKQNMLGAFWSAFLMTICSHSGGKWNGGESVAPRELDLMMPALSGMGEWNEIDYSFRASDGSLLLH